MKVITTKNGVTGVVKLYKPVVGNDFSVKTVQEIIDDFKLCFTKQADFFLEFEEV